MSSVLAALLRRLRFRPGRRRRPFNVARALFTRGARGRARRFAPLVHLRRGACAWLLRRAVVLRRALGFVCGVVVSLSGVFSFIGFSLAHGALGFGALGDLSPYARQRAAEDLGRLCQSGGRDERMLPPLLTALNDSDASVRSAAANTLTQLGSTEAIAPLKHRLEVEESIHVRASLQRAIERLEI